MRIEPELSSVLNNLGTMILCALLIDRSYRIILRWLELNHRVDIYGPKPIRIRGSRIIPLVKEIDGSEADTGA